MKAGSREFNRYVSNVAHKIIKKLPKVNKYNSQWAYDIATKYVLTKCEISKQT